MLVQLGDILDRGEDEIAILSLLRSLDIQAKAQGGAVFQVSAARKLSVVMYMKLWLLLVCHLIFTLVVITNKISSSKLVSHHDSGEWESRDYER